MDEGWEYSDADTQYHVHGMHLYPARMIPQIANRLIREHSSKGQTVLDPFCGSGSVPVEALGLKRNAIGIDINPLAIMIAKAKTTRIPLNQLASITNEILGSIQEKILLSREKKYRPSAFYFKNINHWFKKDVITELSIIKEYIDKTVAYSEPIQNFLKVCFSVTVLKTSNVAFSDNPYFARAKSGEKLAKHAPNTFRTFEENVQNSRIRLEEFLRTTSKEHSCRIIQQDSRKMPLETNSVDLVVTSPPYGEESHTMSYSRFSKLSMRWLGFTSREVNRYVTQSLGGTLTVFRDTSPALNSLYRRLVKKNAQRAKEVFSFFWDYKKCLDEISRVLSPGSFACIVIGDRSASGLRVSNGELTKELAQLSGMQHVITYHREIPRKVLPRRDYKVDLINKEDIVILKRLGE